MITDLPSGAINTHNIYHCCVCVAKSNYHCCLLFRRIKYGHTLVLKIWDRLYVMVNMYLACTYLYICYIFHKQICWTWEGKSVETSLGKWSIMPCHAFGDNVKPCHNSTILRQESELPSCHLEQMHGKCD